MKSKGDIDDFLKALFKREAGGVDHTKVNYAGYIGKYQFGESALIDLGYYAADATKSNDWAGRWKGKNGVSSLQEFLSSPSAQDTAAKEWVALLCKRMRIYKLDAYIGKTIKGIEITDSGIIAGAHLKGFGSDKYPGVRQFLKSNGELDAKDGLNTTVSHYVELFAGYDVDCCKHACLAFAEKKTGAPISGLKVQIKKNGKVHRIARTDGNGLVSTLNAFNPGDAVEILVERLEGGYKSLKKAVVRDLNLLVALVSPRSKATIATTVHEGPPKPRPVIAAPPVAPAPAPTVPTYKSSTSDSKVSIASEVVTADTSGHDSLDAIEQVWQRMDSHQSHDTQTPEVNPRGNFSNDQTAAKVAEVEISEPRENEPDEASEKIPDAENIVEKDRNTKGHPVAILKNKPEVPSKNIEAPMQKVIAGLLFPLDEKPQKSYKTDARRFGANRSSGKRKHAGIDLYAPVGTPVRAMADGVVIQSYLFYGGTYAIEVDHGTFIARYGELAKQSISVKDQEEIRRGQIIGKVGQLNGLNASMLHLEMYGTADDPTIPGKGLTQKTSPFNRRADLIDPTDSIDKAVTAQ